VRHAGCDRGLTPSEVVLAKRGHGEVVSWGGVVSAARHLETATELDVIAYPLDSCGRPLTRGQPLGRFRVRHPGDLEPMADRGRQITATGRIQEIAAEHHRLPLLDESVIRFWPERQASGDISAPLARPLIRLGIEGGSGHVEGGIGIIF
jgi:outer membrane lipoprotein